jgi:hypothetical protein
VSSEIPKSGIYTGLSRGALLAREEALRRFAAWAETQPCTLDAATAIAAVSAVVDLLPSASRRAPLDASGVMAMHRLLAAGFARR